MNKFEIKEIPGKGRAMVALKNFAAGESIFEEEAFVSSQFSWNKSYGYLACDFCMRPMETITENIRRLANNNAVQVPFTELDPTLEWAKCFALCSRCNMGYCSEDCLRSAYHKYHRVGCLGVNRKNDSHPINILNETWKQMHYPPETSSIMLIVRIMAMYEQSKSKEEFLATLQDFQTTIINEEQKIYHKMMGEHFEQQMSQLYQTFVAAFPEPQYAPFTSPDGFKTLIGLVGINGQGIATSVLAEWVRKATALPLPDAEKSQLEAQIDVIYDKVGEFAGEFLNNEGSGLYVLQSKINHSCSPNAESSFPYSNDIILVKAVKPIAAGEEICISYLDECQLERSRHSRQKILRENYIFQCDCSKCREQSTDPDVTSDEEEDDDEMDVDDEDMRG